MQRLSFLQFPQAYAQKTPEELVGKIDVPKGVALFNAETEGGIGIVVFLSNMIAFVIILGGIWTVVNLILAAFAYFTGGGKSDAHNKIRDRVTMSAVGLLLMIVSYSIAALIGLVFYGDSTYIISPSLTPIGP